MDESHLLAAILAAPEDPQGYLVLADWLQGRGHPRGELIALQRAADQAREAAEISRLRAAEQALLRQHADRLVAPFEGARIRWRLGFFDAVRLAASAGEVRDLLRHPSARLLRDVELELPPREATGLAEALAAAPQPSLLRRLAIGTLEPPAGHLRDRLRDVLPPACVLELRPPGWARAIRSLMESLATLGDGPPLRTLRYLLQQVDAALAPNGALAQRTAEWLRIVEQLEVLQSSLQAALRDAPPGPAQYLRVTEAVARGLRPLLDARSRLER